MFFLWFSSFSCFLDSFFVSFAVASSWQALVLRRRRWRWRREVAGRIGRSPLLRLVFLLRPLFSFFLFFFSSLCLSLPLCNVCLSLSSLFSSSVSLYFSLFVPPWFFLCLLVSVFPGFFCSFLSLVLGVSVFLSPLRSLCPVLPPRCRGFNKARECHAFVPQ